MALLWLMEELHVACQHLKDGFPAGAVGKNPPAHAGDTRDGASIPESGRSHAGGYGNLLSILAWRIPWNREAWWATDHGVTKSWLQLSMHAYLERSEKYF